MRTLVHPPPSRHCGLCGGELRLRLVESANRALDLENEIFVCAICGHELSYIVDHDKYAAHATTDMSLTDAKSRNY
jgi:rRNA maturation endonuclease Nob1